MTVGATSVEMIPDETVLSEFTMCFLFPGNEEDGWKEERIVPEFGLKWWGPE